MTLTAPETLFLAELTAYVPALGTTTVLRYASGRGYVTGPSATPANTYYDARIDQAVDITRTMFSGGNTQGKSSVAVGDLVLDNHDGLLDDLIDYGFDGRSIVIRASNVLNPAYPADFRTVLSATMDVPEHTSETFTIKIRDRLFELGLPIQSTKYAGTNALPAGLEGVAADLKGKPKPLCYGVVTNIAPPCVNTSKLIYQVHDGVVASVDAVYDRGIPIGAGADNWTVRTSGFGATTIRGLAYGGGVYVAVGDAGKIYHSTDAITWVVAATPSFGATNILGVCYGNGLFVAVGEAGKLATSSDGDTWTQQTSGFGVTIIRGVAYGNGLYVAVGDAGTLTTSPTGTTWTVRTSGFGANAINAVAYGAVASGDLWVIAGALGNLSRASDGITWTTPASPSSAGNNLRSVVIGRGLAVAMGDGGESYTSLDGVTWTGRANGVIGLSAFRTTALYAVTYANGLFVAAGAAASSISVLGTSADGIVWTLSTHALTTDLRALAPGATGFVVAGASGALATSAASAAYASLADLQDDTLAPSRGTFKAYLAGGYIRLGLPARGLVTADVTQGATAADRTAAQLWKTVLTRAGKSSSDYSAADVTALDVANSAVLGRYIGPDEIPSYLEVLDQFAQSVLAWWGVDSAGLFRIKQFTAPSGTAAITFTANDLLRPLDVLQSNDPGAGTPAYRCTVRWGFVSAVQTTDLAYGVTDARRGVVAQEWREASDTDTTIQTSNLLAPATVEDSLLTTEAAAQAEATRRLTLRKVRRDRYELVVPLTSETSVVDIGSVIELQHPRFALSVVGSSAGALFRVLDVLPNAKDSTLTLSVWGRATSRNRITTTGAYRITTTGAYRVTV